MISGTYTYTTLSASTADEAGLPPTENLRLLGYTIRETAGGAATVDICHGAAAGTIIAAENLAAAGSVNRWFGPQGLPVDSGVWIERLSGTSEVTLTTTIL